MKRSSPCRPSSKEVDANLQKNYGGIAKKTPTQKAREEFRRPAYQARRLIREQGQQVWHGDVTEYIARKYGIGDDADGEEIGREQRKKRE